MTYQMNGVGAFGAISEDPNLGCATTVEERKAIQSVLNFMGFKDKAGKPLVVDGVWNDASKFAMNVAGLTLMKQGKIKHGKDLCSYLRLGTVSFKTGAATPTPAKSTSTTTSSTPATTTRQAGSPTTPSPPALPAEKPRASDDAGQPSASAVEPGMSRNMKLALAFGGLAIGGLVLGAIFLKKREAKPNRATGRFAQKGEIITVGRGKKSRRFGHKAAPKKYREMGAVSASQYAWPQGFKYPIHDAAHVRSAASRFAQQKSRLPMKVRKVIAKNINQAKKRFGIGGKPVRA